jgi:1-acyl-sn-glycerol-3-phosphate acyltransferase
MKKINYIETEKRLFASDHGFEFHYRSRLNDTEKFRPGEPVAILLLDGWHNNKSKPIHVRIHPVSSPKIKDMDEKPEIIIAEVKEAIDLLLNNPRRRAEGQITDHVWIWING